MKMSLLHVTYTFNNNSNFNGVLQRIRKTLLNFIWKYESQNNTKQRECAEAVTRPQTMLWATVTETATHWHRSIEHCNKIEGPEVTENYNYLKN